MAWSGDVFGLAVDDPDMKFIVPKEGAMRWSDNMCIPVGAEHVTDAHLFMDYVYRLGSRRTSRSGCGTSPRRPGAGHHRGRRSQDWRRDPRRWPKARWCSPRRDRRADHGYKVLDADEEEEWADLFDQVVQG